MGKTLDLRGLIYEKLTTTGVATYYRIAPETTSFPYIVFDLSRVTFGDSARDDFDVEVDIWDKSRNPKTIDEIADNVEELFNTVNDPQSTILPTFFRENRYPVPDNDKDLQHLQLHFSVELYKNN